MLPLLHHEKAGVPDLASFVIFVCRDGVVPEHVEALMANFDKLGVWLPGAAGSGRWLPRAIATIRTDLVAKFLADAFRKMPIIHGQTDRALAEMGELAVPHLVEHFRKADPEKDFYYFDAVRLVFQLMDGEATAAILPILTIAEDRSADIELRKQAAKTIGYVGPSAESVFPRLQALVAEDSENFEEAVYQSITNSGTLSAAEALFERAESEGGKPVWFELREIANIGKLAEPVGPKAMHWLNHPDAMSRSAAASMMGEIGYLGAREELENLLSNVSDWRLAYSAATSLSELKSDRSITKLQAAAERYWFPAVREEALAAINFIRNDGVVSAELGAHLNDSNVFKYNYYDVGALSFPSEELEETPDLEKQTAKSEEFPIFQKHRSAIAARALKQSGISAPVKEIGHVVSLEVEDGLLLAINAGEWGGGLQHASKSGGHIEMDTGNYYEFVTWHGAIYATSEVNRLGSTGGRLNRITFSENVSKLEVVMALPGYPEKMWPSAADHLVVECVGGTVVFISPNEFRYYGQGFEPSLRTNLN